MKTHSLIATVLLSVLPLVSLAAAATPVVCIALPKAQLGQGNNSAVDVSEPVRTTLGQYMAGPSVQLVRLDARIPVQIEAEAAEKSCGYILQTTVVQKKKAGSMFKKLAPLAGALPMLAGDGRRHGRDDGNASGLERHHCRCPAGLRSRDVRCATVEREGGRHGDGRIHACQGWHGGRDQECAGSEGHAGW